MDTDITFLIQFIKPLETFTTREQYMSIQCLHSMFYKDSAECRKQIIMEVLVSPFCSGSTDIVYRTVYKTIRSGIFPVN